MRPLEIQQLILMEKSLGSWEQFGKFAVVKKLNCKSSFHVFVCEACGLYVSISLKFLHPAEVVICCALHSMDWLEWNNGFCSSNLLYEL